eukprot:8180648-Pyramimonas_sp.AAC.1
MILSGGFRYQTSTIAEQPPLTTTTTTHSESARPDQSEQPTDDTDRPQYILRVWNAMRKEQT